MSKVVLTQEERQKFFKRFLEAVEHSSSNGQLADFLLDFFSETEIDSFIKRLEVFKRLKAGHSYAKLNQDLSVSPITASKVAKSLRASSDSFQEILDEVAGNPDTEEVQESNENGSSKRDSYLG